MHIQEASRSMGNARRRGNDDTFHKYLSQLKKTAKEMDNFEFSALDGKAREQAHQVARIEKATGEILDAQIKLKQIDKRSK